MAGFGISSSNKTKPKANESGPQLLKAAVNAHKAGNIKKAEELYLKAIDKGFRHEIALSNLGVIYKDTNRTQEAIKTYELAISINPNFADAYTNLGNLLKDLGQLDRALTSTLKSLDLKPDNPTALINLGSIYKDLGNFDQALASTLKSLDLKPDNPTAHMNLGGIYKDLDDLDQALASTLKSLELNPGNSKSLYLLGTIKMAFGEIADAKKILLNALESNPQESGPYYELSRIVSTKEETEALIKSIQSVNTNRLTSVEKSFLEFGMANCFHKLKKYDKASKYLEIANHNRLKVFPSNANKLQDDIANNLAERESKFKTRAYADCGKRRIFIVGMPRSGSTLLETVLSINPRIKDLGESKSLKKGIIHIQKQEHHTDQQNLDDIYSQLEPIGDSQVKYTIDKQLYNFIYISWIAAYMPAAKIIHCRRNPMDNILSMYRNNLTGGNNYTFKLADTAKVLIAHEKAMQIHKKRHPEKIFIFDYDKFVNTPKPYLLKLLNWLQLEFSQSYLHPEQSTRTVNTASVMQARQAISNKSVGGWKNYEILLKPAQNILLNSGLLKSNAPKAKTQANSAR